jgi:dUTP pyrophosphatase
MRTKICFKRLNEEAVLPRYQSEGAAGFDFHSTEDVTLQAGKVVLVPTGLTCELEPGWELQVRCRSGLAAKHGVFLVNGVGTVDSDYRGEIKVILSTLSSEPVVLKKGERVAQGVIAQSVQAQIEEVQEVAESLRGSGGFGSTGRL